MSLKFKNRLSITPTDEGGGQQINNQDISVTENGVYTAAEGYTGLGTVDVSVDTVNNTNLSVTPSTSAQSFTAASPYTGYGTVDIAAVTSSIDSDITSSNIKSGVNILGVTGNVVELVGQTKSVTINGTVTPDAGYNALTSVTVNVPSSVQGFLELPRYMVNQDGTVSKRSGNIPATAFNNIRTVNTDSIFYQEYMSNSQLTGTVDFYSLTSVSGSQSMYQMFRFGTVTGVDFTSLTSVSGSQSMLQMFANSDISGTVSFPSLTTISGSQSMREMFLNCYGITGVSFPNLTTISGSQCTTGFCNGTSVASVTFPSLSTVTGSNAMAYFFANDDSITSISFPALTANSFGTDTNQFNLMLESVTSNCTVHFPFALKNVLSSWADVQNGFGGSNTTVLFDLGGGSVTFNLPSGVLTTLCVNGNTYSNIPSYSNFTISGAPTIDNSTGVANGFSSNNYLTTPDTFPTDQPWEMVCKFTTGSGSGARGIIGSTGTSLLPFYIDSGYFYMFASSNGVNWNIFNGTRIMTAEANTTYKLKIEFTGSAYNAYSYEDGDWVLKVSVTSSTPAVSGQKLTIGKWSNNSFEGSIDLSETYINVNGSLWWSPITSQNSVEVYYAGDLNYNTYFSASNTLDYGVVANIQEGDVRTVNITDPQSGAQFTLNITNDAGGDVYFVFDGAKLPVTGSNGSYTVNINNGTGKELTYSVTGTPTTGPMTGTVTLTGSTQSETITLPSVNFTIVGSPSINYDTMYVSSFGQYDYLTTTMPSTLPSSGFEYIVKVFFPSSDRSLGGWYAAGGCASTNLQIPKAWGTWSIRRLGLYTTSTDDIGAYNMLPYSQDTTVWVKYIQSATGFTAYGLQDNAQQYTLDTLPTTGWTQLASNNNVPNQFTSGTFYIGQNPDAAYQDVQFWPGGIYLDSMVVRDTTDGTVYWKPFGTI